MVESALAAADIAVAVAILAAVMADIALADIAAAAAASVVEAVRPAAVVAAVPVRTRHMRLMSCIKLFIKKLYYDLGLMQIPSLF